MDEIQQPSNSDIYHLSRLIRTGIILSPEIPECVIKEIASAHGITVTSNSKIPELIFEIKVTPIRTVEKPFQERDWRYIARFINASLPWKISRLQEAFDFYCRMESLDISLINPNFKIGLQTQEELYNLNATILYGICHKHGIQTHHQMTIDQLAMAVRFLVTPSQQLISYLITGLSEANHHELVNFGISLFQDKIPPSLIIPSSEITYDQLFESHKLLTSLDDMQDRLIPRHRVEVIALVAHRYLIDISSSTDPYAEYLYLQKNGICHYIPVDRQMAHYYKHNPQLYSLEHHFNPLFPEVYYSRNVLIRLIEESGSVFDRGEIYSVLAENYLYNTFYHGLRPNIKNQTSSIELLNLTDVPSNIMLCFGNPVDGFIFLTYNELADFFRVNKSFQNPFDKRESFTPEHIYHLKELINKEYPDDQQQYVNARNKLLAAINHVEIFNEEKDSILSKYIDEYNNELPDVQQSIAKILIALLHLGMYMRGWEGGNDPFPVEKAPYKTQGEVDIRVSHQFGYYRQLIREIGEEWGNRLQQLPLVKYEGNRFIISDDEAVGKTIGEKLEIVEAGEINNNVLGSCIRASSGWIVCTAYRYMVAIEMEAPFNINRLIYIT